MTTGSARHHKGFQQRRTRATSASNRHETPCQHAQVDTFIEASQLGWRRLGLAFDGAGPCGRRAGGSVQRRCVARRAVLRPLPPAGEGWSEGNAG